MADQRSDGLLIIGADSWVRDLAKAIVSANVPVKIVDTNFAKVSLAKQAGLDAVCINMLNEHAREELELAGIGKLLAMTPNDEVNSLIVRECRAMFERKNGFQLMFDPGKLKSRRGVTKNLMGRALFHEGATYTRFRERHDLGSSFKVTPLSEEFTYAAFAKKYQDNFELLAVISEDGKLTLETPEKPLQPNPGDRILTLVGSIVIPDEHPVGV
ncbi:MAG: NAD-binding protein [Planctomycetota bacterium]